VGSSPVAEQFVMMFFSVLLCSLFERVLQENMLDISSSLPLISSCAACAGVCGVSAHLTLYTQTTAGDRQQTDSVTGTGQTGQSQCRGTYSQRTKDSVKDKDKDKTQDTRRPSVPQKASVMHTLSSEESSSRRAEGGSSAWRPAQKKEKEKACRC
jgi:hypothetical protein